MPQLCSSFWRKTTISSPPPHFLFIINEASGIGVYAIGGSEQKCTQLQESAYVGRVVKIWDFLRAFLFSLLSSFKIHRHSAPTQVPNAW